MDYYFYLCSLSNKEALNPDWRTIFANGINGSIELLKFVHKFFIRFFLRSFFSPVRESCNKNKSHPSIRREIDSLFIFHGISRKSKNFNRHRMQEWII